MKTYETEIDIAAPPESVWQILTEFMPATPEPFGILKLEGQIKPGGRLKLWSEVSPNRAFVLRVVRFDPPHTMEWQGEAPFGLFTGTRRFVVEPNPPGSRFTMRERFTGPLAGLITKSIPDLTPSFVKFAKTLKLEAENNE